LRVSVCGAVACVSLVFSRLRRRPCSTLFPYTTLFRSFVVGVREGLGGAQRVLGLLPARLGVQAPFDQQRRPLQGRRRLGRWEQGGCVGPAGARAQPPYRGLEGIVTRGRSVTRHGGMRRVALPEHAIELLSGGRISARTTGPGQEGG